MGLAHDDLPVGGDRLGGGRVPRDAAVLDDDRSVKAVAAAYGCTWNTCHNAVVATADPVLDREPDTVVVLGIDETRARSVRWVPKVASTTVTAVILTIRRTEEVDVMM